MLNREFFATYMDAMVMAMVVKQTAAIVKEKNTSEIEIKKGEPTCGNGHLQTAIGTATATLAVPSFLLKPDASLLLSTTVITNGNNKETAEPETTTEKHVVTEDQIKQDLATSKFDWDHPQYLVSAGVTEKKNLNVIKDPYETAKGAHSVCILTEWNEFKSLDYQKIYDAMEKPVFFFDGRNVVNVQAIRKIGFIVYLVGKPLDDWIKDFPATA
ncbi:hypothetical protein NE237_022299 [Protea cynaroides]|uniref:UDP-glucose/GDP-mannose dehydrogenase C-terminal domain-containing protein n=1 Tax=Protea cynaroides TaxID=273540 RepID=A0A9Q0K551_9MAGN|nr:hypothetical protein NE237_022299 [Protea cynaroides]